MLFSISSSFFSFLPSLLKWLVFQLLGMGKPELKAVLSHTILRLVSVRLIASFLKQQ